MEHERQNRRSRDEIVIQLSEREDRNGNIYYVAWPTTPASIWLGDCMIFVFPNGKKPLISIRKKEDSLRYEREVIE